MQAKMTTKSSSPDQPRSITLTRYPTPQQRFNLYMPVELVEGLKKIAAAQGVSYSEVIKRTMTQYLQSQTKS
jgi:predicted DNA binding CopG/RHH family protein